MNEVRLPVFHDSLEYRFSRAGSRGTSVPVELDTLLARLREADPERCQRLILSGGSPILHPGFVSLARESQRLGFRHVAVETDAAPLGRRGMMQVLKKLGITQLVVLMGGLREETHGSVMQDGQGVAAALSGLQAAVAAAGEEGPRVYLAAPLLRSNVDDLEPLLDWASRLPGTLQGFLLALPEIAQVPPEARGKLLPYSIQAQVAARLFQKCRHRRLEYGFLSKRGILPCAAAEGHEQLGTFFYERSQYLQHTPHLQERERFVRVDACASCSLNHNCPGAEEAYLTQFGGDEIQAVPIDVSMDWKLRRTNRLEQFEYRNISPFRNEAPVSQRGLIRINGHCNMSCAFCFVDRTVPDFESEDLRDEIRKMAEGGTRHLVISGGEPTLHKDLPGLIRFARSLGVFDVIEMQSNGVRCADADYARELVEAGLNKVTFSLHSADPEHSDRITRLPHAFGKTVQAIHHFRALGILTQIAHVLTKANYAELPNTVRFLRNEFPPEKGHLSICLAIAQGISDLVFHWVIPTFTEIKPYVSDALDYCLANDIGFGGMIGQGGYPPCMLDGNLRYYESVLDKVFRSEDSSDQFYKPEKCRECSFDPFCLGPRRSYVEHYGDEEIRPFRAEVPDLARSNGAAAVEYSAEAAMSAVVAAVPTPPAAGEKSPSSADTAAPSRPGRGALGA